MTRLPALLILAALAAMALYSAGVVSWTPTPWETHTARTIAQDARKAAKAVGVRVNIQPKPPGITPAKAQGTTQAQNATTLYPTPGGQAVPAPKATQSITSAYCQLEQVSAATCAQLEAQAQP